MASAACSPYWAAERTRGRRWGAGTRAAAMPLELELCPGRWVGGQHPCFIIAEIGQNHQGDLEVAKRMIRTAKVRAEPGRKRRPAGAGGRGRGRACGGAGTTFLCLSVARVRPGVQLACTISKSLDSSSSLPTFLTCLH